MNLPSATQWLRGLAAGIALAAAATPQAVQAQGGVSKKVLIGLAGKEFGNGKSITANSKQWKISPSGNYYYSIDGQWAGKGTLAAALPKNTRIAAFLEAVKPGSSRYLKGSFSNPSGTLPATVLNRKIAGARNIKGVGKVNVSLTLSIRINSAGLVTFSIKNMKLTGPAGNIPGTVRFGSGTKIRVSAVPL